MEEFTKNRIYKAIAFMKAKHREIDQRRKYTNQPYEVHPLEVYSIVKKYLPKDENAQIAALLHDTVEDTKTTLEEIEELFGQDVRKLVADLTDISKPKDGNRAARKAIDREHTKQADPRAKTVKLADLISNSKSIMAHDKDFARTYIKEKALLLEVLSEGHPDLYKEAEIILIANQAKLEKY